MMNLVTRHAATRWLMAALFAALVCGLVTVLAAALNFTELTKVECKEQQPHWADSLGKWDDILNYTPLTYFVCESELDASLSPSGTNVTVSGCGDGWSEFNGACYKRFCNFGTYAAASKSCNSERAFLVSIGSAEENTYVQRLCGYQSCFIGLAEIPGTEDWRWADGTEIGHKEAWRGYTNWDDREPDNWGGRDETVAVMNFYMRLDMPRPHMEDKCEPPQSEAAPPALGKWDDVPKEMQLDYAVCQIATTRPKPSFFLGQMLCHFSPSSILGDFCYKKICVADDYEGAAKQCSNLGGSLASIKSAEENAFVQHICGWDTCWIGLLEPANSERWVWEDGTDIGQRFAWRGYTNWNDGEPNNFGGRDEDAAIMNFWKRLDTRAPRSIKNAKLAKAYKGAMTFWMLFKVGLPAMMLCSAFQAYQCRSACCAQAVCLMSGISAVCLVIETLFYLFAQHIPKVARALPGGFLTLLVLTGCASTVACCFATSKAQELQWQLVMGAPLREVSMREDTESATLEAELTPMQTESLPTVQLTSAILHPTTDE